MKKTVQTLLTLLLAVLPAATLCAQTGSKPVLRYTFEDEATLGGRLYGGATLATECGLPILDLGMNKGYLDFGMDFGKVIGTLHDFTISTYLYLPVTSTLGNNGNFIFSFAHSNDMIADANGCMFLNAKDTRYAITQTGYTAEQGVSMAQMFATNQWKHVAYVQNGTTGSIFIDGQLVKTGTVSILPSDLGNTVYNYLGKPCYAADTYLIGAKYCDLRIYDTALDESEMQAVATEKLDVLNTEVYRNMLNQASDNLTLPDTEALNHDLTLPLTAEGGVTISWASSNESVLTAAGKVTRPAQGKPNAEVKLTATLAKGSVSMTKEFSITVLAKLDVEGSLEYDLCNISLNGNLNSLYSDLILPTVTVEGSILSWKSSDEEYLSNSGKLCKLAATGEKKTVTLRATATKEGKTSHRDFDITIGEDEGMSAYLFTYFTGNKQYQEQICYAVSTDGYTYTPLNNGNRVVYADSISIKKGVRDPHILRGEDGNFRMVVTDMQSSQGWDSNDGLVLMKSSDLINWTHTAIDFPDTWPSKFNRDDLTQVWAPQTIYDPSVGKYMVYYSIGKKSQAHYMIYYSYANEDFTELTEPQILFDLGSNTIDADIVYHDGLYHMFYKTEGEGNGIQKATAPTLQGPWTPGNRYLQQTTLAVEGSGVFKLINSNDWVLMYDCYTSGFYQFCSSSDLENFTFQKQTATTGTFTPRHGTVIAITQEEAERILQKWPSTAITNTPRGSLSPLARTEMFEVNTTAKTISLPVRHSADLSNFDPQLYGNPGVVVSPKGAQDFTNGAVEYSFALPGKTATKYMVTVEKAVNPILPDYHADPEILYSHKTNKFYCYTTTDGVAGWGGTYFTCYSSPNLVDWNYESTVLDLATSQVSWASGNAWAPAIEEKLIDGEYKYFFYFSGNAGSNKQIGVATADTPIGPFTDHGTSIIKDSPTGGGQQIDVDVFTDPVSKKSYIYWGNGYMAGAELKDDMATLVEGTTTVMTPAGGTLDTYAYREAPYVFYRNGKYYFLWSVDDTGSANYHVAYGTSDSPLGKIEVAKDPIVIIQDAANQIYGTAHNSILQIPGKDEWYIVYHRINKKYLSVNPGIHRETCIDRLYFNEDGTIQRVTPTRAGIDPVDMTDEASSITPQTLKPYNPITPTPNNLYNLQGQKVAKDYKGIVITEGKKVLRF